ncbi:MAG: helix-turn-helix transcriptional regulator [Clostridia bacterium]|nr:helix-turn-helix transcriptional regulator [Clostridia bacterium]
MGNLKFVSFEELYPMDVEITDIRAERQKWIKGVLYNRGAPRKSNAIILLSGCNGIYTDLTEGGTSFFAPQGSIVCLPEGSNYSVLNNDCDLSNQDAYMIEFHIKKDDEALSFAPSPFMINSMFSTRLSHAIKEVVRAYEEPIKSPISILSCVCEVLSILGKENSSTQSKDYSAVAQGLKLLEKDPFNDISIEEIASICNISSGSFRRNFRKYLGKSPIQYRTDLRIKTIQFMLENSDVTIENMSELLGINNAPYIYKMFKKNVGLSPGEYRSKYKG